MPAKKFPKKFINTILGKSKRKRKGTKRMKPRKDKKSTQRKMSKINTRRSTSGKIHLPLDVKSPADIPTFLKALKSKNLTIILVYATWCPHCHTIMPHFDAASKSPNRTVSPVKINETMLANVNKAITQSVNHSAKPISVDGYPSIIIVNNKAEQITSVNPVNDTQTLTSVMENAGPLAEEANLTNANLTNANNSKNVANRIVEKELPVGLANQYIDTAPKLDEPTLIFNQNNKNSATNDEYLESPLGSSNVSMESINESNIVEPPELNEVPLRKKNQFGGSLMSAMARSTYTLAPTATLLAAASSFMKTKKRKKR